MRITRTSIFTAPLLCSSLFTAFFIFSAATSRAQFQDDFTDGDFTVFPSWTGDTADFIISFSSAVPPEQKPALQLDGEESDTSYLVVSNNLTSAAEWRFWIKLSFNTSMNNFARFYLFSDHADLTGELLGYFIQVGGANDSVGLYRQTGFETELLLQGANAFTGNSTNVMRIKVTREEPGTWRLFSDPEGGYDFTEEGIYEDTSTISSGFSGIWCRYTSSNSTKFYFDDFYADVPGADTIPPSVVSVAVISPAQLELVFSEPVVLNSAADSLNYFIPGGQGYPLQVITDPGDPESAVLSFGEDFEEGTEYLLEVSGIKDYSGNILTLQTIGFAPSPMPQLQPHAVLISEIMADANPEPAGLPPADYLELYNPGPVPLNLKGVSLKPRESSDPIYFQEVFILPGEFLLVVRPADTAAFSAFGPVAGLPGFALNNEGTIVLRNGNGALIHAVTYDQSYYKDGEKENGGWSLELRDTEKSCSLSKAWSASVDAAGGTPGAENSIIGEVVSLPSITALLLKDSQSLVIHFSHAMDSLSLVSTMSYKVGYNVGFPVSANCEGILFDAVELVFEVPFPENKMYSLELKDSLFDGCGQPLLPGGGYSFIHPIDARPWDVVINEVMADPDPPVGLPGFEYVELYNSTDRYIRLSGWTLAIGNSTYPVEDAILYPEEFVLLAGSEEALIFSVYARTLLADGLSIPNSGGSLILRDDGGKIMAASAYSPLMFSDPQYAEGGYSLEQVDPYNPCSDWENWRQTEAPEGGTPGSLNSVDAPNERFPEIISVIVADSNMLSVTFNTKMENGSLADPNIYHINAGMGVPDEVIPADSLGMVFSLVFGQDFHTGIVYTLTINETIKDCVGNEFNIAGEFFFGMPEYPGPYDVVINEVLFNPAGEGVDFVEIFNRSDKVINLRDLLIGTVKTDAFGATDTVFKEIIAGDELLLQGNFRVLTTDPTRVREQYFCGSPSLFTRLISFPAYNNDEGRVLLFSSDRMLIDHMVYSGDMHHPLLKVVEGVSLERLHPDRPSDDPTNWHSASTGCGYATPALQNSQFTGADPQGLNIQIEPGVFSPDNDGVDDVANIGYSFKNPGNMVTIIIFDAQGRPIRTLVNNEMLGTEGTFSWDGSTDDRRKANIGIYVVYFEAFGPSGKLFKQLIPVVLGGRLH